MITDNEKKFVKAIVDHVANVAKVQEHIREHFGIQSYYDEDNETLHLVSENLNEGLALASAKEYVNSVIDETMLNVVYGM